MSRPALSILFVFVLAAVLHSAAAAGWPPCETVLRAEAGHDTVYVYHDQAEWNCCATIVFEFAEAEDTLNLYEFETFEVGPCVCLCCFDLETWVAGVAPGEHLVRVLDGQSGAVLGQVWVTVQASQGVEPSLGFARQSECGGFTGIWPEGGATWGRVKVLFR